MFMLNRSRCMSGSMLTLPQWLIWITSLTIRFFMMTISSYQNFLIIEIFSEWDRHKMGIKIYCEILLMQPILYLLSVKIKWHHHSLHCTLKSGTEPWWAFLSALNPFSRISVLEWVRNHNMALHIRDGRNAGVHKMWQRSKGESDKCLLLLNWGFSFVANQATRGVFTPLLMLTLHHHRFPPCAHI